MAAALVGLVCLVVVLGYIGLPPFLFAPPSHPALTAATASQEPLVSFRTLTFEGESPALSRTAKALTGELERRFSAFDNLAVPADVAYRPGAVADNSRVAYEVAVQPREAANGLADIVVIVTQTEANIIIWTRTYRNLDPGDVVAAEAVVRNVTQSVADVFGVIANDMRKRKLVDATKTSQNAVDSTMRAAAAKGAGSGSS